MNGAKTDRSNGYEAAAREFAAARGRTNIGVGTIKKWSATLKPGCDILELGCGNGVPVSKTLIAAGHKIYGIDASPTLIAEFRERFPNAEAVCEAVEDSKFFDRTFDAAVAVGLVFLLPENVQQQLIRSVAAAIKPCGRFLFTSPSQAVTWADAITGQRSVSLGAKAYKAILADAGSNLAAEYDDEGRNHYYDAVMSKLMTKPEFSLEIRQPDRSEEAMLAKLWYEGWQDAHAAIIPEGLAKFRTPEMFEKRMRDELANVRVIGSPGAVVGFHIIKGDELNQLYVAAEARGTGFTNFDRRCRKLHTR